MCLAQGPQRSDAGDAGDARTRGPSIFMDLMAPVFNQALKAGHVGFVTDTYIQCISSSLYSLTNILAEDNLGVLFNNGVCNKRCTF